LSKIIIRKTNYLNMSNQFKETVQLKSKDELLKMVYEFDEWSPDMLLAVETELSERKMLPDDIGVRKQQVIIEEDELLSQGKPASLAGQIFGWVFVLGLIGLYIGYNYAYAKVKSKYTGKKYLEYDEASREVGSYIFYASIAALILGFIYAVVTHN
jgi:hypothetical protein